MIVTTAYFSWASTDTAKLCMHACIQGWCIGGVQAGRLPAEALADTERCVISLLAAREQLWASVHMVPTHSRFLQSRRLPAHSCTIYKIQINPSAFFTTNRLYPLSSYLASSRVLSSSTNSTGQSAGRVSQSSSSVDMSTLQLDYAVVFIAIYGEFDAASVVNAPWRTCLPVPRAVPFQPSGLSSCSVPFHQRAL